MVDTAPRDLTFFLCFGGFLGGLIIVVVTGALMRNWARDNDDQLDPDQFAALPVIGSALLLISSVVRYVQLRKARALPLALGCLAGAAMTGISAYVLDVR